MLSDEEVAKLCVQTIITPKEYKAAGEAGTTANSISYSADNAAEGKLVQPQTLHVSQCCF